MTDSTRLKDKVVIVTGGGSGIGKGASQRIADEGGRVVVVDKRLELAQQVADSINAGGGRAIQPAPVAHSNLSKHVREDRAGHMTPPAELPRPKPWLLIRRMGDPYAEYGATIAFLLSDEAGYITGSSIPVDGGYLAT